MAIYETQKLSRSARQSQEEFLIKGSLLSQTSLNRFILIAFLLHVLVITLQSFVVLKSETSSKPPAIKIKYVQTKKPNLLKKTEIPAKTTKPKKVEKQKTKLSKLPAEEVTIHANTKPKKRKKRRRNETLATNTLTKPNITQRALVPSKLKKERTQLKKKVTQNNIPLMPSNNGILIRENNKINDQLSQSKRLDSRGVFSMIDKLDFEKYATQETLTEDSKFSDNDKPISLDTKEAKYMSYFRRIKQQIQRVWRYPSQAVESGISGQLSLKFQISRDGNLLGVRLVDNSGFEILDMAAVKAVKEAAPYYPFPLTIPKKKLSILATFVYSPNTTN